HDVGGGREVGRCRRGRGRAGREADACARSGAARARRPARCARRAQHGALRHTSADRERARVRPQRGTRFRYPRALRAIGSRAPPLHLRAARWVHGRLARPHSRQTAPRGARPLRRDGRPAARLPLVARLPGARRPGRRDAGIGGRRAPARARGRAARRGGARGARRAGAGPMGPALGGRVAVGCGRGRGGLGLALLDLVAHGAALVPGGHIVMVAGWQAALLWAAVAAAAWWLWNSPRRPWLMAARLAFCATVVVATSFRDVVSLDACRCLTVHFLDVGQGDAAALRTPNGRWIVIDGGPRTPERDAGRRVVVPFLRDQGVGRVAVVVATHGDADHLGGLPAVVEAFDPELVLEPGEPLGRPLYLEFLAGVEASGARWHAARAGDRIEVDGVVLEVLSPDSLWLRLPLEVNEHGVVLRVRYGAVRLLFQADAGLPVEGRLAGTVGRVEVLKVGHHGSKTATSDAWLDELAPREAVISVGRNNHYGHPAPEVLERLARHGVTVLRTDRSGTITLSTDGHGERVRSHHD